MRHRRSVLISILFAGLLAPGVVRPAAAQTINDLFDQTTLQELRLFVNSRDMAELRAHYLENTFYPADLVWRNIRVRNIGIRSRGAGSRDPNKPGLRLDFNKYAKGQTFLGLEGMDLRNNIQDASMMHEKLAMEVFARMGQPTSRESYARVYINNVYHGVYTIVEEVGPAYLTRTLGENAGYLFEYHWMFGWYFESLGDSLAPYEPILEPNTHTTDPESTIWGPVRDMVREINGPFDEVWFDRVNALIDIRQFVTYVAIENFLAEWDGITGNFGMNNFFLYRPGGSLQHRLLVWDRSEAFKALDSSIFLRTEQNVLFSRAMAIPDLRTLYLDTLQQCAESVQQDNWLATRISEIAAVITAAAYEDPRKLNSNADYDAQVQFLFDWAAFRPTFVLQSVANARAPFTP